MPSLESNYNSPNRKCRSHNKWKKKRTSTKSAEKPFRWIKIGEERRKGMAGRATSFILLQLVFYSDKKGVGFLLPFLPHRPNTSWPWRHNSYFSFFSYLKKGYCNQLKSYTADSTTKERNHTHHHLMKEPQGVQTWVGRFPPPDLERIILAKWCCGVFQTLQYFIHLSKSLVEENKWKKRKRARFSELRKEQVGD